MARARRTAPPPRDAGIMSRLRARPAPRRAPPPPAAKIEQSHHKNPITGTHTTTTKRTTHPRGYGHHGHGGRGPMASEQPAAAARTHRQRRKPGIGDKLSGAMMKLKGSVTRKPGVKVGRRLCGFELAIVRTNNYHQAAGTRRMHGTDGRRRRA